MLGLLRIWGYVPVLALVPLQFYIRRKIDMLNPHSVSKRTLGRIFDSAGCFTVSSSVSKVRVVCSK